MPFIHPAFSPTPVPANVDCRLPQENGPSAPIPTPTNNGGRLLQDDVGPQQSPGQLQHDFDCHATNMLVHIPSSLAPNSKMYMRDKNCELTNNGTHFVLTLPYDSCGTALTFYTDYVFARNEVTVHLDIDPNAPVQFDSDYEIPLECKVPRDHRVDGAFVAVTRDPIVEAGGEVATAEFVLREFKSALYREEITEYPLVVPLNKEVFFEVDVENVHQVDVGVYVTWCDATPTPDADDPRAYRLIEDGCPASPAVHIEPVPSPDRFRFRSQSFHFSGEANNENQSTKSNNNNNNNNSNNNNNNCNNRQNSNSNNHYNDSNNHNNSNNQKNNSNNHYNNSKNHKNHNNHNNNSNNHFNNSNNNYNNSNNHNNNSNNYYNNSNNYFNNYFNNHYNNHNNNSNNHFNNSNNNYNNHYNNHNNNSNNHFNNSNNNYNSPAKHEPA
ncbi:hypothetical protein EGW08_001667 [Elysia chlorotica]|uniref:ZP domain-containing protein n=1 Tax=Elysia chlorotica TaxID=188477 RepID=A0A3S1BWP1_ELYCH|nr:hypothetical protein EGW08_001667 [Elysia chlorotica]